MSDYACMDAMWKGALQDVLRSGQPLASRNGASMELLGWDGTLLSPTRGWTWNPARKLSAAYGSAELLWYLAGSSDATMLKAYAPSYENYLDDGVHAYGAYGPRMKEGEQLRNAITLLKQAPNTRQCVITVWRQGDIKTAREGKTKDLPCTLTLQLLWRDQALHMIVTMRSNDAWMGMPYDVWCFTTLQRMIAACLDAEVGCYRHQVGSLHLYEPHWERARVAIDVAGFDTPVRATRPGFDCVDEMERMIGRAIDLEKNIRTGGTKDITVVQSLLGGATILGEAVACCMSKLTGVAPEWLDARLR